VSRSIVLVAGLIGCMGGPDLQTRIEELRVVAARAEPAAVAPGEPYDLVLWVADPQGRGGDVVSWSCVEDLPCAPVTSALPAPRDGSTAPIVQSRVAVPAPLWILACAEGDCGDLDDPAPADLRDPFGWLQRLPLQGVSAASRLPPVALGEAPPVNPTIAGEPETGPDQSVARVELAFAVTDAEQAFGYATSGGFEAAAYDVAEDGTVTLAWVPDPEPRPGEVFVVFTNPEGGTAVWQAPVP